MSQVHVDQKDFDLRVCESIERCRPQLRSIARSKYNIKDDIFEDIVQDLYLRVSSSNPNLGYFDDGYIVTSFRNLCIDFTRSRKRSIKILDDLDFVQDSRYVDPANLLIDREDLELVRDAVLKRDPDNWTILMLVADGRSHKEISRLMGIKSFKTVGTRVYRAREYIEELLRAS
jgi:RNA polymerase sigma factor (sigma-70 family)